METWPPSERDEGKVLGQNSQENSRESCFTDFFVFWIALAFEILVGLPLLGFGYYSFVSLFSVVPLPVPVPCMVILSRFRLVSVNLNEIGFSFNLSFDCKSRMAVSVVSPVTGRAIW